MGKPVVFIVAKGFEASARFNAQGEGLSNLSVATFPLAAVPTSEEIKDLKLGEKVSGEATRALTQKLPRTTQTGDIAGPILEFSGRDYAEATGNMEKYFLQRCWSDGYPLVPPTPEAVDRMLEGTELARSQILGLMEPGAGKVTVEKVAVNAVMAGCLPHYMPVVVAAIEAILDPRFDLRGVQTTAGLVSPLLIISGQKLIDRLNINDSFSTMGPGWRANATIGRAVRLCMINLGYAWPGKNDMKSLGSPFKHVTMIAESEHDYNGAWEPIRVAEGFAQNEATVSVMPAVTWQPDLVKPELSTTGNVIELVSKQAKVKYDRFADMWGMDNLLLVSPTVFDIFRKERRSRSDIQKALFEAIQLPCKEFFAGKEPAKELGVNVEPLPDWLVNRCKLNPGGTAPLLPSPEAMKICVTGGPGPGMFAFVGTWGFGPAFFVTKAIKLPANWENLLEKYKGWETPAIK